METVDAIKDLKKKLDEQYRLASEALDIAIALSEKIESGNLLYNLQHNANLSGVLSGKISKENGKQDEVKILANDDGEEPEINSVRDAVRAIYPYLPEIFKKSDIVESIKKHYPDFPEAKITPSAISTSIRKLHEEEVLEVARKGIGNVVKTLYRKIKKTAEKPVPNDAEEI